MSKPIITRISSANPEETLQIFGENLSGAKVYFWFPDERIINEDAFTNTPFPPRPDTAIEAEVTEINDQVIYAYVPYTIEYGCFLAWIVNSDGEICTRVNRPEIWNDSLKKALPDDRFTLYGQNYFGFNQRYFVKTTCAMKNLETGKIYNMRWGACQDIQQNMPCQDDHKSDYRLPKDIPAGKYVYAMTNGTGGAWGWSECRELEILEKRSLTEHFRMKWNSECRQNTVFDMSDIIIRKIDSNLGDGFTDVTEILQNEIDSLAESGGIVLLPAGKYGITKTLILRPGVILKGAGMGATTLTVTEGKTLEPVGLPTLGFAKRASDGKNWSLDWKPFMERENNTPLTWITTDAGMEDLTLEGGSGAVILSVVGTADGTPSEGVFFNKVNFENGINSALYMHGQDFDVSYHGLMIAGHSNDLTIFKCSMKASFPLMILPAQCKELRMIGNTFEVSPRQTGDCVYASGLYGAVITENSFNLGRRSLISQQGMFDSYVFQNRSYGVANTTNANEEYMSEYGQSAWVGHAVEFYPDAIKLDFDISKKRMLQRGYVGENLSEHRWFLMIMSGKGIGQYRIVDHIENDKIYINRPWDLIPDESTCFNLITASQHNLWIVNFAGMGSGNSQFVYGSGIENIVAGHSMLMTSGISMYAMMPQKNEKGELIDLGVVAYNKFIGCDARYSGMGLCLWTNESWSLLDDRNVEPMNQIGNIVRYNSFLGGSDSDYVKNQTIWTPVKIASGIQSVGNYCLMEKNLVSGYDAGIHIRYGSYGNLITNNTYKRNDLDIIDDGNGNIIKEKKKNISIEHGEQRNINGGWYYDDGI